MKTLRFFSLILLCCCSLSLLADGVKFVSGKDYQIRCVEWPDGCVVPNPQDEAALSYSLTTTDDSWWTITLDTDGTFIIRNAASKLWWSFDGQRTATRRYMSLTTWDYGTASRWNIYPGQTALLIQSCFMHQPNHYLNVRRGSFIVGTYAEQSSIASSNERFFLVNRKGKVVTELEGKAINIAAPSPTLPPAGAGAGTPSKASSAGAGASSPSKASPIGGRLVGARLSFTANGHRPVFDAERNLYLISVPEKDLRSTVSVRLAAVASALPSGEGQGGAADEAKGKLYVDGRAVGSRARFENAEGGRVFRLALVNNGDTTAVARISFTALPIVEVTAYGVGKSQFTDGTFRLHDPDGRDCDSTVTARFRYRGDYTAVLQKKTFAVKFVDAAGHKQDRQWLDLRTDNYWILDAMAIDHARCRNRVAMELWQDMAARPYYAASSPKAMTAVRGRLVEVYLNGHYQGVYNFCERADRRQLGLAKTDGKKARGCLYKARDWGTWTQLGIDRGTAKPIGTEPPRFDNSYAGWASWEIKYPEPSEKHRACWNPLYDACELVGHADNKTFARNVAKHFDLPAVRDYYLFIELLHAVDNTGKNMQWAVYDQSTSPMLTPVPWDLDGTFGRSWNGHQADCAAANDYRQWLIRGYMQNGLFERLHRVNPDDWNDRLARRYRELRRTVLRPERLYARFEHYFDLLRLSGADQRETQRWANRDVYLDFNGEATFLKQWIEARIATLDKQYGL